MGGEEERFVKEAFETNWISPAGPHITAFEEELSAYLGVSACAALSSGTAAIHLALLILDVKPGDEVICSTFTFAGSCNPIVYVGATPIFIDSEPQTWNMDPDLMKAAIEDRVAKGKKPKAIIVVHLYGMPAQMDRIMNIAREFQIAVIEDAAEALGSSYLGKKAGAWGDIGIFSFNGNKIITTSGGGALVSDNPEYVERAKFLATQAREKALHYEHREIGYNYRLSNVCAAIGRGQLRVLDARVQKRRQIFEWYRELLGKHFIFPAEPEGAFSNRWLTTPVIKFSAKTEILQKIHEKLESENIESRPLWKPMHLQPVYKHATVYQNGISEYLFNSGICLPSGSLLEKEDVERISKCLFEVK